MSSLRLDILEGKVKGDTVLTGISVLGRGEACAVVINDRGVSREHAMIREEPGMGFMIEDLDSRSGTFVNGIRTRKAGLLAGDTIKIGPVVMRVRTEEKFQGEVPLDEVELVKTKHLPTQRLSLDAVRFRTSRRFLKDQGLAALRAEADASQVPGAPAAPARGADAPVVPPPAPPEAPLDKYGVPVDDDDDDDPETASIVARRLEVLCEVSNSLAAIHDPTRLTRETAVRLLHLFPQCRRIGFFQVDDAEDGSQGSVLRPTYLVDRAGRERQGNVQVSSSVIQGAIGSRQAILSEDVSQDPRFRLSESASQMGIRSIMCAPLCLGERVMGAVYVDSEDASNLFDEGALRLLTGVGAILSASYENARLFAQVQKETVRRASLERYFSPDLVDRVMRGEVPLAREGRLAEGTILFIDVRGFTRMTLTTDPSVLVATLNSYFTAMQRIIFRSRGTVERFGGDSILAYWGIVDQDPHAPARCLRAALAMQVELFRLNPELRAAGRPELTAGIGLDTGEVIAGDVGSAERYEFTILGDAVNMAARLESLSRSGEIIAGSATVRLLGDAVLHLPLPPTTVKGKEEEIEVSAVFGLRTDVAGAGGSGERRFDMAVQGQLDLGGGPKPTMVSGLELAGAAVRIEVLTEEDPEPGTPVWVSFQLPRGAAELTVTGQVLSGVEEETLVLSGPSLAVAGSGVQRIKAAVSDPQGFIAALRRALPQADPARGGPSA